MKAKVFEVVFHKLPTGKSPISILEDSINGFLDSNPALSVVATHMNTVVLPPEPHAMSKTEESSIVLFCTVFYKD